MKLTVLQWNIGGGKISQQGDNLNERFSYSGDGMDHVLYSQAELLNSRILSYVKTDHYPVYCEFELY